MNYTMVTRLALSFATLMAFGIATTCVAAPRDAPAPAAVVPYPPSASGKLLSEWLSLCRTADLDQMTAWLQTHLSAAGATRRSAAERTKETFDVCRVNDGLNVHSFDVTGPEVTLLAVGPKNRLWYNLSYIFDESGKLDRMGVEFARPPEDALPRNLTDRALAREIHDETSRLFDAGLFSGIVLVARGNQVIATTSVGYADRIHKTPITAESQFTIGSVGKIFTAVAVGQLVDQKKLSYDDKVGRFFPDYPNTVVRDQVTVGMLLSHTAGLGDFLEKRPAEMLRNGVTKTQDYLPLFDHDELEFPPGKGWAYSNAGLVLAGAIVEKVSGEDYFTYLQRHIFEVAGMSGSEPNNVPHTHGRLVTPYTRNDPRGGPEEWRIAEADIGSPAGGAISTAHDLLRFATALRDGRLVSSATLDAMCTPDSHSPAGYRYGYGTEIEPIFGQIMVGHSGGFSGVSVEFHFLRNAPYATVALSNQDPPSAAYIGSWAMALTAERAKRDGMHQ